MILNRAALIALPFAVLAAACSPAKGKADAPAKAAPAAATAAAADMAEPASATTATTTENADGAVWSFTQDEDGANLTFTVPESDDVVNYLSCKPGKGMLEASVWADHGIPGEPGPEPRTEATQLTLTSGAVSKAYAATAESEEMYGGSQVTAGAIPLGDPVIAEFGRTGSIQMKAFGVSTTMPAASQADVQKLLKACKKG